MKNLKFTKITIYTTEENLELLTSRLDDLGADGFEFGNESGQETVTIYIPEVTNHSGIITFLESESLKYTMGEVAESDWENEWKQYFFPIPIGNRLVIKPSWCEYDNSDNRIVLEIDPASAFGTGQHASTRLCLESLEKQDFTECDSVLDVGCGSGILSAAAGLLGAESVTAIDICDNAIRVTEETFQRNNITQYSTFCGNIISDEDFRDKIAKNYDLVVANITADVIIAMSHLFPKLVHGRLILSGIIEFRLPEVIAAIEPHFEIVVKQESEDWVALVCSKK